MATGGCAMTTTAGMGGEDGAVGVLGARRRQRRAMGWWWW